MAQELKCTFYLILYVLNLTRHMWQVAPLQYRYESRMTSQYHVKRGYTEFSWFGGYKGCFSAEDYPLLKHLYSPVVS